MDKLSVSDQSDQSQGGRHHRHHHSKREKTPRKEFHQKLYKNPYEIFLAVQEAGVKKSHNDPIRTVLLGFLGGVYVGFGGIFALTAAGGIDPDFAARYPMARKFLIAATFPVALVFILIVGGELYTGNVMYMISAFLGNKVKPIDIAYNWSLSLLGNLIGACVTASVSYGCEFFSHEPFLEYVTYLADYKVQQNWGILLMKAVPCNMLVCMGIWIAISAEDIASKIIGMYIPISTFAAIGFEHSIANMFFVTNGILYGAESNWGEFLYRNLIPVLLGNLIGGGFFIATLYWYIYGLPVQGAPVWSSTEMTTKSTSMNK